MDPFIFTKQVYQILFLYLLGINLLGFLSMGMDKHRAIRNRWRIPESTLLLFAILFGSIGSYLGMQVFHHKTRHRKFFVGIPVIFCLQVVSVFLFIIYFC